MSNSVCLSYFIAVAIGLLAISSTVTMAVPFAVGRIINMISDSDHRDFRNKLGSFSLLLLGVFLVGAAANGSRYYLMQTSGEHGTVWYRYDAFNFLQKKLQKTHHRSPVRARYGVSFVDWICDSYSAPVTAVIYAISCDIGPRYNGTQLYLVQRNLFRKTTSQCSVFRKSC